MKIGLEKQNPIFSGKINDGFLFFNEFELLEIRLHELNDVKCCLVSPIILSLFPSSLHSLRSLRFIFLMTLSPDP
jgi:hypothetical protein